MKSSFRNAVKLVRRRMSVRKSEENVLVKETKKATSTVNAKGVLETAKSSISWKVKALLGITALVGLCTVLAPVILPVAVTMLEMTFLTALAPYAGILAAGGAIALALLYQFPALRKFAWRAAKWAIKNWRKIVGGFGCLLAIWLAFVLLKIFRNIQETMASLVTSSASTPPLDTDSSSNSPSGWASWDTNGDGALSGQELAAGLKIAFGMKEEEIIATVRDLLVHLT